MYIIYCRTKNIAVRLLFVLLLLNCVLISCRKEEFQVAEEGAKIPYVDSIEFTLSQVVNANTQQMFSLMWKKAKMDEYLASINQGATRLTLLRPTENALKESGWTAQKINESDPLTLQEFIQAHLIETAISPQLLEGKKSNYKVESMFTYQDIFYTGYLHPYKALLSLSWNSNGLWLNGKNLGSGSTMELKDGFIYELNTIISPPQKTAWQVLKEDPRFSIYTGLLERTDQYYRKVFRDANGFEANEGNDLEKLYYRTSRLDYTMDFYYGPQGEKFVWDLNTYFIPTNSAFEAAGFTSVDELMDFNERRGMPYALWQEAINEYPGFYIVEGEFATDSLLDYHHNWGLRSLEYPLSRIGNSLFLFTNDFQTDLSALNVGTYHVPIFFGSVFIRTDTKYYAVPFLFDKDKIAIKNSTQNATMVGKDIVTLNGVIHAVDKLLLPTGFSIN